MEPNKYWLLAIGLVFVFVGSRTGFRICNHIYNIIRSCFYLTIALIFAVAAKFMWFVSLALLSLGNFLRRFYKNPPPEMEISEEDGEIKPVSE